MERWLDVKGYEGKYQVSNLGRVKSLNYNHTGSERLLVQMSHRGGYRLVTLHKEGKQKSSHVHRLVAEAFLGICPDGAEVSHLNGIPDDNRVENLVYESRAFNNLRKIDHGTHIRGEAVPGAKLGEEDIIDIRRRLEEGEAQTSIAASYGVRQCHISGIKTGKSWKWLT